MTTDTIPQAAATDEGPVAPKAIRTGAEVIAELVEAQARGDSKRVRELSRELSASSIADEKREVDERNAAITARTNPLKDAFNKLVERDPEFLTFMREAGGVLSYSYTLPAEGSANGPLGTIVLSAKKVATPSAPRTPGSSTGTQRPGKMNEVYGMSLNDLFELVATPEELEMVGTLKGGEGRTDAKIWNHKTKVVQKAAASNDARLPAKTS